MVLGEVEETIYAVDDDDEEEEPKVRADGCAGMDSSLTEM